MMEKQKRKKNFKLLIAHLGILSALIIYALYLKCPLRYFFGLPCPSCGMTRAHLAFLRGALASAFRTHPLFIFALPVIFILLHNKALKLGLSKKALSLIAYTALAMLIGLYLIRLFVLKDPLVMPDFESSLLYRLKNLFLP